MPSTSPQTPPRPLLRPADAASVLGISISTLRRMVESGRLKPVQISARRLGYRQSDIEAMIATDNAGAR